eukprot:CAMPEP_0183711678 /NCGR_PEP_ID=MMETSP0737-20130205/7127_1 /TAXON_ID=385413 /ORGANISM="Thalassiosira miniscula, Strain CCMP1093" /LENGTH=649 /DNA_ID=CAMNT_0025940245 /DNA_START=641 /DNA_END=2590 /DNA_ORIENTATION=-
MGHSVSTARCDKGTGAHAVATSLAILLAVASATSADATSDLHCQACFASPRSHAAFSAAAPITAANTVTALQATSANILSAATVPPPNSRLGRLQRHRTLLEQPPGTKRSQRGSVSVSNKHSSNGRIRRCSSRTDLRYAMEAWNGFSLNAYMEEEEENGLEHGAPVAPPARSNHKQHHDNNSNQQSRTYKLIRNDARSSRRQRARMLRFLDGRLARQLALQQNALLDSESQSNPRSRLLYQKQKAAWAAKYTSVSTLRKSFGSNKNRLWGDFDPTTTRKLYHTLLPRALLELRGLRDGLLANEEVEGEQVIQQELKELAPLAYQARLAAKKYARERSRLPGRIGSMLYDGYRTWRRYGKWTTSGMTWEQVWNKYEDQVLREAALEEFEEELEGQMELPEDGGASLWKRLKREGSRAAANNGSEGSLDDEELTARICLRILERSVVTNSAIDRLFLKRLKEDIADEETVTMEGNKSSSQQQTRQRNRRRKERQDRIQADLAAIEKKFDDDIQELLRYSHLTTEEGDQRRQSKRERLWKKLSGRDGASSPSSEGSTSVEDSSAVESVDAAPSHESSDLASAMFSMADPSNGEQESAETAQKVRKLAVHEVFALRILATTKQRIAELQDLPPLSGNGRDGASEDDAGEAKEE